MYIFITQENISDLQYGIKARNVIFTNLFQIYTQNSVEEKQ